MKNRIAWKLSIYFAITLLLFSLVMGGVFSSLFKTHTIELYKADMEKRAVAIAASLSEYMGTSTMTPMAMPNKAGFANYLQYLDDIALSDVWIVDQNMTLYTIGKMPRRNYIYQDLPEGIDEIVNNVFKGKITFSQGFSDILETPTLTVGAPISANGVVIGALLLHAPVEGMDAAVSQGFDILVISLLIALGIAIILSILFAYTFTLPLNKMKKTAMKLAAGSYDIKTNVHRKDEIGELADAIDTLSERLASASKESENLELMRREFVSNVSHELRTPVTVIRGSIEALNDEIVTDKQLVKKYHRQVLDESIALQRLVDDLLDLSRLQNNDFNIELAEIKLCDVIEDAVRSAKLLGSTKSVTIERSGSPELSVIKGDYGRLRQLLLILLDNAIKFSPAGEVVTIACNERELSVTNRGRGIDSKDLPNIFDRFFKVDSEENKGGTGLGLSIARQIAERHGFQLTAESILNDKTVFHLLFTQPKTID